jgi:protein-S-isoprenylcysteine O-methyltransferase Ste14
VLLKLLGAAASVGFVAFLYWALPEYHGSFYGPFFGLVRRTWRWGVCALVVYFWIVDGLLANPKDVYWQIGKALTGSPGVLRGDALALHLRALLVKAFFLPLMTVYLAKELRGLGALHIGLESLTSFGLYDIVWSFVFAFDLVFAVVGYVLSLRVLDTHVRSAEPTALGWAVTLLCYEPFLSLVTRRYLTYDAPLGFADWLEDVPGLRVVWAAAVVGLILVYLLSTVAFGCRFSNLTHRGIITGGPYRFTKHPAYLAKNLAWWLVAVPFIPDGGAQAALRRCLLLLGFNLLYFLRARTEERHLSRDPDYVRYALWMNDHGLLRALGRHVPALRYTPPTSAPPTSQPS